MLDFKHSNTTYGDLGSRGIHWYTGRTGTQTPASNTMCDAQAPMSNGVCSYDLHTPSCVLQFISTVSFTELNTMEIECN